MKRASKHSLALLLMLFAASNCLGQKKPLISNYEEVVARAKTELDSLFKTGMPLPLEAARRGLQGAYVMDVTVHDKGQVRSVFVVSSNAVNVEMQNRVKDFIRAIEFGFKVPKSTTYKFRYTFLF